jgi:hypothetical protein
MAAPDDADRRASRNSAPTVLSADSAAFAHAVAGSAPSANRSAARLSTAASGPGADGAVAAAADDTAIPERRQAANTSRLEAAANGSSLRAGVDGRRTTVRPARILGRSSVPSNSAAAKRTAAQLISTRPQ